jgi:hypothetical protein
VNFNLTSIGKNSRRPPARVIDVVQAALGRPVALEIAKGTEANAQPILPAKIRELFNRIEAKLATP